MNEIDLWKVVMDECWVCIKDKQSQYAQKVSSMTRVKRNPEFV